MRLQLVTHEFHCSYVLAQNKVVDKENIADSVHMCPCALPFGAKLHFDHRDITCSHRYLLSRDIRYGKTTFC